MPLADHCCLVADLTQQLWKGLLVSVKPVSISHEPVQVTVFTSEDDGTTGSADGVRTETVLKEHAVSGQTVDIRCRIDVFEPPVVCPDRSGIRNLARMTARQRTAWDAAYGPKNKALLQAGLQGRDLVRWKYNRYIRNYLRCIKGVDESLGTVTKFLQDNGLAENTIVIYSSDQGFYLGDHGWYDKRWMYEESFKMPLIVKWPGVTEPGTVRTELVQNLDYAETFLDIAGADIPADMQGQSLVPLLTGHRPADWRTSLYYHYYEFPSVHQVAAHFGIRTQRYKLIRFYQFDEWEFYDLRQDPDELRNAYRDPAYADVVSTLKTELKALRSHYRDNSDDAPRPDLQQKFRPQPGSPTAVRK